VHFSTESTLISSKISSFLLSFNKLYPAVRLMNFISAVFSLLMSLLFIVQSLHPYKGDGVAKILYYLNRDCVWTKFGSKTWFTTPQNCRNLLMKLSFRLHMKFFIEV